MWERSFVAVSVLVGGSIDDAMAALPEGTESRPGLADLGRKLRDPRRAVRAQALALVAQEVTVALGAVTLR